MLLLSAVREVFNDECSMKCKDCGCDISSTCGYEALWRKYAFGVVWCPSCEAEKILHEPNSLEAKFFAEGCTELCRPCPQYVKCLTLKVR